MFAIAASLVVQGQTAVAMEEFNTIVTTDEICALMACRKPTSVLVYGATPDHDLTIPTPKSPFVFQGVINLVLGERIAYILDVRDDLIRDMRRLYPEPPGQYFSISLNQQGVEPRGNSRFSLHNVLDQPVTFGLDIVKAGNKAPEPRLTCSVAARTELILSVGFAAYQVFITELEIANNVKEASGGCHLADPKEKT